MILICKKFIQFNPKIQLKKGTKAKKVDMDKLVPFTRKITGYIEADFTGGSKFINGDTLLARITPCLENGKTAYVNVLEDKEVGFGSTEFIVLRAIEGISIPLFIYYLAVSPDFREIAIASMSGTSGRQRVDVKALEQLEINLPPLEEQKRIAEILGSLDDKIELLQKQNKTLEDMAKALFKSWFVDFDVVRAKAALATRRNLSPLRGKCHNVAKGGPNKPNSSCALVSTHQIYAKSVKNLVRAMRQNLTPQEVKLWQYLRKEQMGVKFRRQFPIDSKYIADFACLEKKLIIELDGTQHAENQHDKERTLYLEDNGFTVMRFWNNEIDKNLIGCLERIREVLNRPPLPAYVENSADNTPLPAYGVLSPQGGQKTAQGSISSPDRSEFLQEQGEQIADEADIMREYHLTEELYDLFPSSFADSPLGPIPSGWEVKTIQEMSKVSSGKRPQSAQDQKSPTHNVAVYGGNGIKWWTQTPLYTTPIIITGRVGTLGQVYRIYNPVWISDNALVFETNLDNFEYLFYMLKNVDFSSFNRGSTQPLITQGDIKNVSLVYNKGIIKEFHNIVVQYEKKILLNNKQIQTLTELRDTLLPRLISGKIRV